MTGDAGSRRSPVRSVAGLTVSVVDAAGRAVRGGPAAGLTAWLTRLVPRRVSGHLTVALVSDARMRALNREFRRQDYATDVLSFPASAEGPGGAGAAGPPDSGRPRRAAELGDVVVATGVARRQARQAGHSERTELRVLALHGLLHLLGYDHEEPADAGTMARIERQWRRKGGLPAGLIDRAEATGRARRASRSDR